MKKISILALSLGYGGIEKAITDLANNLTKNFDVEIISTYKMLDKPAYKLNKSVKVTYLIDELKPNRQEFWYYFKTFRFIKTFKEGLKSIKVLKLKKKLMIKALKECDSDIILSTRIYHNSLLSKYGKDNTLKIAWEHNHHQGNQQYINKLVKSCSNVDKLVLVSNELYEDYKKNMEGKCECVYIPHMIDINKPKRSKLDEMNLITIGRFSPEKGMTDLPEIIYHVREQIPNIKFNIIGDGPLFDTVKTLVDKYNVGRSVKLHGYKDSDFIHECLSKSVLYVMPSYTESFGLTLLESFSHGVPAVSFSTAEGALELIENDVNGYIVNERDNVVMAKKIVEILQNRGKLKELGKNSIAVYNRYLPGNIIEKWYKILK
ncbi:MAG: glycosyltransferase [Bacilli bacterium]|nr:glycosyltransferase [Bacilli bacterium]